MWIKTKHKGIYATKGGAFFFITWLRNKRHHNVGFASLEEAALERSMYVWAREFLKRKDNLKINRELGVLVSEEDEYLLKKYRFLYNKRTGYHQTDIKGKKVKLHKIILDKKGRIVDHKNRNRLDNRRENLRYCTGLQNRYNCKVYKNSKSGFKGIYFDKDRNKPWRAAINFNYKNIHIGRFKTKEEAVAVRQAKAKELFGEFYNG